MRKSTIVISTVLSTFTLVMLYGVVSAYRNISTISASAASQVVESVDTTTPEPTLEPVATQAFITPEEAAQLAAQVVGNTNLLSAESSNINGTDAYLITFTNNDVVYVGLDGQILGIQVAPQVITVAQPVQVKDKHNKNNNNNNSGGQSSEDHEEHDDD